jgi:hypothetical protein
MERPKLRPLKNLPVYIEEDHHDVRTASHSSPSTAPLSYTK